jgi:hypothetical protein
LKRANALEIAGLSPGSARTTLFRYGGRDTDLFQRHDGRARHLHGAQAAVDLITVGNCHHGPSALHPSGIGRHSARILSSRWGVDADRERRHHHRSEAGRIDCTVTAVLRPGCRDCEGASGDRMEYLERFSDDERESSCALDRSSVRAVLPLTVRLVEETCCGLFIQDGVHCFCDSPIDIRPARGQHACLRDTVDRREQR